MMRRHVLPFAVWLLYWLWSATWRKTVVEHPTVAYARRDGRPLVFAHWHGDELAIVHLVGRYHIATMTSTSQDGRLMERVVRRLGGRTCSGSSTRGGMSALKGLVRLCRSGHNASMAVDGPRGPLHEVKPGVFQLARLAGGAIVPVGVASDSALVFHKSWNQARLPWPFTRVVTYFGPVEEPPVRHGAMSYTEPARQLATAIDSAGEHARKRCRLAGAGPGRYRHVE